MRRLTLTVTTLLAAAACAGLAGAADDVEHSQDRVLRAYLAELPAADGGVLRIGLAAEDAQYAGGGEKYLDVVVEHRGGTSGTWRAGSDALPRAAFSYTPNLDRAVLRTVSLPCVDGCAGRVEVSARWQAEGDDLDLGRSQVVANDGPCDHYVVARVHSERAATGSVTVDGRTATGAGGLHLASRVRATDRSC